MLNARRAHAQSPIGFGAYNGSNITGFGSLQPVTTPFGSTPAGAPGSSIQTLASQSLDDLQSLMLPVANSSNANVLFSSNLGQGLQIDPLFDVIQRTSQYDYTNGLDAAGNPLPERLARYVDDFVNDPRKNAEEIKDLLSNIRPDMDIPQEAREGTPDALRYPLYPHQQLALKWMKDMEEGSNKGGILADDMGLGKTISTLALIASRPSQNSSVKVRPNSCLTLSPQLTS